MQANGDRQSFRQGQRPHRRRALPGPPHGHPERHRRDDGDRQDSNYPGGEADLAQPNQTEPFGELARRLLFCWVKLHSNTNIQNGCLRSPSSFAVSRSFWIMSYGPQRILADRNGGLQTDTQFARSNHFNSISMLNHLGALIALTNPTFSGDSACKPCNKSHSPFAHDQ